MKIPCAALPLGTALLLPPCCCDEVHPAIRSRPVDFAARSAAGSVRCSAPSAPSAAAIARPRGAASPAASAAGSSAADRAAGWPGPPAAWPAHRASASASSTSFSCCSAGDARLRRLVLVLRRVQLQIEEAGQVAARVAAAPTSTTAALTERHFESAGRSPPRAAAPAAPSAPAASHPSTAWLSACPLRAPWPAAAACMSLSKSVNSWFASEMSRLCMRIESAFTWSRSFCCASERNWPCAAASFARRGLVVLLLPRRGDQFFLALGDLGLVVLPPPPPPPPPPPLCCDCENSRSNGSTWMKLIFGARLAVAIARRGIDADHDRRAPA